MSVHQEWFTDPVLWIAEPGTIEGSDSFNDEAALIVDNFDSIAVIQISEENYRAFAQRLREIADAFDMGAYVIK
jgi:hypothetical protein